MAGIDIGFTALFVLFLEHWRLFYFNKVRLAKYGKSIYSTALKLSFRHLASIGGNVAKIWAKTFIRRIWNWVYGILRSIFLTLQVYLHRLKVLLPRYGWNCLFYSFEIGLTAFAVVFLEHWRLFCVDLRYGCQDTTKTVYFSALKLLYDICLSIFRTLEVILHQLDIRLPRYRRKCLLASFEIVFTEIAVLFLEHWWLFCFGWRYCCQDTEENVYSPSF